MRNEAEVFMSALITLKLCWAIHKSNDEVRKCAGVLKRKFILPHAEDDRVKRKPDGCDCSR